jgi:hypothetical protein
MVWVYTRFVAKIYNSASVLGTILSGKRKVCAFNRHLMLLTHLWLNEIMINNPFQKPTTAKKIENALHIQPKTNKFSKIISLAIHFLLYLSIFLAGYIFAKFQTLVGTL